MKDIKLIFNCRFSSFHYFVLVILLLDLYLGACSNKKNGLNYFYPTGSQQRVHELCTLVFHSPYYQYISPSRSVKLRRIRTTSWGFWATFEDGRTYRVPVASGLNLGEDYYCNFRSNYNYCSYGNDLEDRCEWN